MNDRRFLAILNQAAESMAWAPLEHSERQSEADAVQTWAEFLRRCVERGVSVGDPRWSLLEAHRVGARPKFRLPAEGEKEPDAKDDFSVGLTLLMGVLHPEDES